MSILIIEDDCDAQELYRAHLQISPFVNSLKLKYCIVSTGLEGLWQVQEMQPKLICLDMVLPDMSGLELLKILKCSPTTSHIPVIAVTALALMEDREKILAIGADAYLSKPYFLREFEYILGLQYLLASQAPKIDALNANL